MKKILSVLLIMIMVMSFATACSKNEKSKAKDTYTIGIIQYVSHPSLDNCYAGVEKALKAKFGDKVKIEKQIGSDASPDSDCATYAANFVKKKADMIIAIATPAAMSAYAAADDTDIPVIFCAVSDPVEAELVKSIENPGTNCTGTSDVLDLSAQLDLITSLQPDVKNIGIIYTTSEPNSISQLKIFKDEAAKRNINVNDYGIQNDADIPAIAAKAASENDCLNNFTDNKVVNNLSVVLEHTNAKKIPVYGSEVEQVKNGCLAAVSIDYVALGEVTGNMAADVLEGADAAKIPVKTISDAVPVINSDVLNDMGLTLPEAYKNAETVTTNK